MGTITWTDRTYGYVDQLSFLRDLGNVTLRHNDDRIDIEIVARDRTVAKCTVTYKTLDKLKRFPDILKRELEGQMDLTK